MATFHPFDRAVTRVVLADESFYLEEKMVGAWRPQRASAELSIFPVYGYVVHTVPGWLHFDMETLILVTLSCFSGPCAVSPVPDCAVPPPYIYMLGFHKIVCKTESESHYPYG